MAYPLAVDAAQIQDLIRFSDTEPVRETLFETERLWSQVVCLARNQAVGPVGDPGSDAVVIVAAGEVAVQVDRGRKRLKQWGSALVPAGAELTITNASPDPAVVVVVTAPPPAPVS